MRYYAPGERKGNRHYIARGSIAGRPHEINTRCSDKRSAQKAWRDYRDLVLAEGPEPELGQVHTFAELADLYMLSIDPSRNDRRYIDKLKGRLGACDIAALTPADIQQAAHTLYPTARNETKNRQAIVPAAAILHFAAKNGARDYVVVDRLREREPETRRPAEGTLGVLIANTDGWKRALLVFLHYQGWRIGETLSLRGQDVDLPNKRMSVYVSKAGKWKRLYMTEEVFEAFANLGIPDQGPIWPWRTRGGVYKWLNKLCRDLGVQFTPHMARHDFGSELDEIGVSSHGMTELGTWTSTKSTDRYKSAREGAARAVLDQLHKPRATSGPDRGTDAADRGKNRGNDAESA